MVYNYSLAKSGDNCAQIDQMDRPARSTRGPHRGAHSRA